MSTEQTREVATGRYRPEIDGLRAFAVVAVIINHFNKDVLPGGYLGVDIFFVISGYVITSSLDGKGKNEDFGTFLGTFYARRIKRLVPALVVFALITTILICLVNPNPEVILRTGLSSLLGLSNLYLLRQSTDYFAESTELNPFTHTWSLGVEEQFYFIFPLAIWFTGFSRSRKNSERFLLLLLILLSCLSFARYSSLLQYSPSNAYFEMPSRFWELGLGAITYLAGRLIPYKKEYFLRPFPGLVFLLGLIPAMLFASKPTALSTLCVVLSSCCLLAKQQVQDSIAFRMLTQKYVLRLGLISYSLYLYHWTVISISKWTIGISIYTIPFQICGMLVFASLSYRYVEMPFRNNGLVRKRIAVLFGSLAIASTALGIHLIYNLPMYAGKYSYKKDSFTGIFPPKYCNIFDNYKESVTLGDSCGGILKDGAPTIYLLGDSHANQFTSPLLKYGSNNNYNVVAVVGNNCNFPPIGDMDGECFKRQLQIENRVFEKLKRGDIVIVGNALVSRLKDNENLAGDFKIAFTRFSDRIAAKGGITVLFIDSIQFSSLNVPGAICSDEWFRPIKSFPKGCTSSLKEHRSLVKQIMPWRTKWSEKSNNVIWDAADYQGSCIGDYCTAARYLDNNHFSAEYAYFHFQRFLRDKLSGMIGDKSLQ